MRSRAKAQMEDTSDSKEEEMEPLIKKGRKPNKFHMEKEIEKEKAASKQLNLDHLVKSYLSDKQIAEQLEVKNDRVVPPSTNK